MRAIPLVAPGKIEIVNIPGPQPGSDNVLVDVRYVVRAFPAVTNVYPFDQTAQAFRDWDAAPNEFIKILINLME